MSCLIPAPDGPPRPGWAGTLAALARFAVVVLSITLTLAIAWRLFAIVVGA